jgi:hypothetical protein
MSGQSGDLQGAPHVVCGVCGKREITTLRLMLGYVVCTPRDIPPGKLPPGAVHGNYHWKLEPTHDETIRIWCGRHALDEWLEFSKCDAVAAAQKGGTCRAFPAQRG